MLNIDIITLFPSMFKGPFAESIVKRAIKKERVKINIHNLRQWTKDKRKTVDDRPFGGGTGMILMIEPIYRALNAIKLQTKYQKSKIILLSPSGKLFNQEKAREFSELNQLILICGHYEGVDQRVADYLADEEISIGDYILTGGEIPAMVVVDAIVRLLPGVLEKPESTSRESFSNLKIGKFLPTGRQGKIKNLLEYPQYTRQANFRGWKVPEILLSGNHKKIEEWRKKKALEKTRKLRPDLLVSPKT